MLKRIALMVGVVLGASGAAYAVPVLQLNTNFDGFVVGAPILGYPPTDFTLMSPAIPPGPLPIGNLHNEVFFDTGTGLYTYVHVVTPGPGKVFNDFFTGFPVMGYDGTGTVSKVGYSHSQATTAGMSGATAFEITFDPANNFLRWDHFGTLNLNRWSAPNPITFFFQSTSAPQLGLYNVSAVGTVGSAISYAPTPEPSVLLLLGAGLLSFRILRRRS